MSGDTFSWNGGGSFIDPNMWQDLTDPTQTGTLFPTGADTAIFSSDGDVSDSANVGSLEIDATVSFAGAVNTADTLTVSAFNTLNANGGFGLGGLSLDGTMTGGATGYLEGDSAINDGASLDMTGAHVDFGVLNALTVAGTVSGTFRLLDSGDIEISGNGSLTTHSNSTSFSIAGAVVVGVAGHPRATIDVSGGGSIESDTAVIGAQIEEGLGVIDAAHWTNAHGFTVRGADLGTLKVKNAGTLDTSNLDISPAGPGGTATITGAGSVVMTSGGLVVGQGGSLLVTANAHLDDQDNFADIGKRSFRTRVPPPIPWCRSPMRAHGTSAPSRSAPAPSRSRTERSTPPRWSSASSPAIPAWPRRTARSRAGPTPATSPWPRRRRHASAEERRLAPGRRRRRGGRVGHRHRDHHRQRR